MAKGLFEIDWKDVGGATLSAVIAAVFAYISTVANISDISLSQILSIAVVTALASLTKAFTTDNQGYLLGGSFKVK